jgi:hypothetical protein
MKSGGYHQPLDFAELAESASKATLSDADGYAGFISTSAAVQ